MQALYAILALCSILGLFVLAPIFSLFRELRPLAKKTAISSIVVLGMAIWQFEANSDTRTPSSDTSAALPTDQLETQLSSGTVPAPTATPEKAQQKKEWDERAARAAERSRERGAARKAAEASKPPLREDLRQEQITKELAAKLAKENGLPEPGSCRDRLECWGEQNSVTASFECSQLVERSAKYTHEWTDGWMGIKFSHYRWKDKKAGVVTHIGDKVRFQNVFGAWQNMVYECDFDPASKRVLDVRVRAGRL